MVEADEVPRVVVDVVDASVKRRGAGDQPSVEVCVVDNLITYRLPCPRPVRRIEIIVFLISLGHGCQHRTVGPGEHEPVEAYEVAVPVVLQGLVVERGELPRVGRVAVFKAVSVLPVEERYYVPGLVVLIMLNGRPSHLHVLYPSILVVVVIHGNVAKIDARHRLRHP